MTDQISVIAQIRPGKRGELERLLEQGPPFDLAAEGFERHEVFVGDNDVLFVFTGPGAMSQLQRMAASRALFAHILKLTAILSAPRVLDRTYEWEAEAAADTLEPHEVPVVRATVRP